MSNPQLECMPTIKIFYSTFFSWFCCCFFCEVICYMHSSHNGALKLLIIWNDVDQSETLFFVSDFRRRKCFFFSAWRWMLYFLINNTQTKYSILVLSDSYLEVTVSCKIHFISFSKMFYLCNAMMQHRLFFMFNVKQCKHTKYLIGKHNDDICYRHTTRAWFSIYLLLLFF